MYRSFQQWFSGGAASPLRGNFFATGTFHASVSQLPTDQREDRTQETQTAALVSTVVDLDPGAENMSWRLRRLTLGNVVDDQPHGLSLRDILRMKPLFVFLALQLLDVATTIVALGMGGTEQNPLVARFFMIGPISGLILSKILVILLAGLFVWRGRTRAIRLANGVFTLIVVWNLTVIGRLA
jgi:hypothetical protein